MPDVNIIFTHSLAQAAWWSKAFVLSALICLFLLVTAPVSYKFELFPLMAAFSSMLLAVIGALLVFVFGLGMVIYTHIQGAEGDRNILLLAIGIALIPLIVVVPQISKAISLPPIHDITTDTVNPPQYVEIAKIRSTSYALEGSASKLARLQMAAYPLLRPIESPLVVSAAVDRAVAVLGNMGLEIISMDRDAGIVEATAMTFWFGFKDDVVVRIKAQEEGSVVDLRSSSRVGQSDKGVNAARIMAFSEQF